MSSDLRVALRIQATSGNSRREIAQVERDLRQAGKEGARSLANESWKAGAAVGNIGRVGAASYKVMRQGMRDAAQGGTNVRLEVNKTAEELKAMSQAARKAARDSKAELLRTEREGVRPLRESVDKTGGSFRRLAQTGGRQLRTLKTVAAGVRSEFDRIKGVAGSVNGRLAGLGVGIAVGQQFGSSAALDRTLIRTGQTAGMTAAQREEWRNEGFRIARENGIDRDSVDAGFNTLIASGVSYNASKLTADAIGQTTAVTGADSSVLGKAVVAGASAFNIDLEKPGAALDLLQKMTVAGRLGNAELENLADLFPKIGGAASSAGMSIQQALAFTETLSTVEMQPDRLGTLAESTLRIFSNKQYRDQVTKSTGVRFFDQAGNSRNPEAVFGDLKRKYDKLTTPEQRAQFQGTVFKGMDQDTVRGARIMLTGNRLKTFASQGRQIEAADAVIQRDRKENTESASGTAGRMRATLREAMDRMAQPINKALAETGTYLLDDLNLSGGQLLAGGAGVLAGGYYGGRGAKKLGGMVGSKLFGGAETMRNIAVGRVLEEATGVQSVFVTNWPGASGTPELPSSGGTSGKGGSGSGKGAGSAGWLALAGRFSPALAALVTAGSSPENSDEDRLAMVPRNKLISDGERAYQSSYYQARLALADQAPGDLPYAQREQWLTDNARRIAQQQSGLTASGDSVADARTWAGDLNARLNATMMDKPVTGMALLQQGNSQQFRDDVNDLVNGSGQWASIAAGRLGGPGTQDTSGQDMAQTLKALVGQMQTLVGQPLVVEVRSNDDHIYATVERRAGIEARRGK
ncbi:phage tail tape measure protein [Pseudomonas sp. PS02288]|uniref:phage tail tape measure protein n=1 Tax=Pseudomonas sp. PS02288 TaxID=2991443 RepID=UPI00249B63AA|nr:phage tail tape measure protein [Pseudomonas sp. PS02288]